MRRKLSQIQPLRVKPDYGEGEDYTTNQLMENVITDGVVESMQKEAKKRKFLKKCCH